MRVGLLARGGHQLCAITERGAVILADAAAATGIDDGGVFDNLGAFLESGDDGRQLAEEVLARISPDAEGIEEHPRYAPPVVVGAKIICHANNYPSHTPFAIPSRPFFYSKLTSAVIGHGDEIDSHLELSRDLDWECELAVVIGRAARDVPRDRAYEHVAGYTILNDISRRDMQFNKDAPELSARYGMNFVHGKGLDTSCPIGPWITTRDDVQDPHALRIRSWVNGELRQDDTTDHMFYKVDELIVALSQGITLRAGDVIATGSPYGTGLDRGRYLAPGDIVRCEVEGLGTLENQVAPH